MIRLADVHPRPRRVAVGMFDGVHLGHREVMRGADCVLTFDRHPSTVIAPDRVPSLLTTANRRTAIIASLGVPEVVMLPFDAAFAARTAASFVDDVLVGTLGATHVSVGENFRFGHRGAGDPEMLRADPRFVTRIVPLLLVGGSVVSSSSIRSLIAAGEVERAAALLGGWLHIDVLGIDHDGYFVTPAGQALPGPGRYRCRSEHEPDRWFEVVAGRDDAGDLRLRAASTAEGRRAIDGPETLVLTSRVPTPLLTNVR